MSKTVLLCTLQCQASHQLIFEPQPHRPMLYNIQYYHAVWWLCAYYSSSSMLGCLFTLPVGDVY